MNGERKLATIRIIKEIKPIEGADNIECAIVDGWQCVVKKNEFKVGDFCIYCEIDSVLPPRPEFAFLEKVKYRIKTIRLKGYISQGIIFPISILKNYGKIIYENNIPKKLILDENEIKEIILDVGTDITKILNITKYEPPIPANLAGKVKGNFPSFLRKTDEERIQNMDWVLTEYKNEPFYVTEKLDGTSFTAYYNNGEFGVCSRNLNLYETENNTHWQVARQLKLEEKLKQYGKNIALQGELIGEGIQKNRYKLKGQTVYFFNAFDIDNFDYFDYENFLNIISQLDLKSVPIISPKEGYFLPNTIEELLEYSEGKSKLNPEQEREGVVIRPFKNIIHPKFGRISFKVISNKYLLKYEE